MNLTAKLFRTTFSPANENPVYLSWKHYKMQVKLQDFWYKIKKKKKILKVTKTNGTEHKAFFLIGKHKALIA